MNSLNRRLLAVWKSLSMRYTVKMGYPHMDSVFRTLEDKQKDEAASHAERHLYGILMKALKRLSSNPHQPALATREVTELSRRYRMKVWQSLLEGDRENGDRIIWVYGPVQSEITVIRLIRGRKAE